MSTVWKGLGALPPHGARACAARSLVPPALPLACRHRLLHLGRDGCCPVALGALGLLACAPYLSELLALSLARADRDGGPETIRLQPILERLCAMADVPVPRLAVMPTDVPNAFSADRNARNASSSSREASSIASTRRSSKRSSPMSWPTSPTGRRSS